MGDLTRRRLVGVHGRAQGAIASKKARARPPEFPNMPAESLMFSAHLPLLLRPSVYVTCCPEVRLCTLSFPAPWMWKKRLSPPAVGKSSALVQERQRRGAHAKRERTTVGLDEPEPLGRELRYVVHDARRHACCGRPSRGLSLGDGHARHVGKKSCFGQKFLHFGRGKQKP